MTNKLKWRTNLPGASGLHKAECNEETYLIGKNRDTNTWSVTVYSDELINGGKGLTFREAKSYCQWHADLKAREPNKNGTIFLRQILDVLHK